MRISCLFSPSLPVRRGGRATDGQAYADDRFPFSVAIKAPL